MCPLMFSTTVPEASVCKVKGIWFRLVMYCIYIIVWQKNKAGPYNPIFLLHSEAELFIGNTMLILQTTS